MHRFWDSLIYPLFKQFTPRHIVEIGALAGDNTVKVLDYCNEVGGTLTIIDPAPHFTFKELKRRYGGHHSFLQALSLEVLPVLRDVDAVLIDGDHNWYTVYHELKIIEKLPRFPLVLLHDIEWPYGRRDLYYNPSTIPSKHRQPYSTLGILPGQSELAEGG
ncbi:class I SAM-dependent methyltransferase [Paenibacillus sp. CC-CFT747]|nr:class I SAM-dependent methyltransferase [Paenibacillus sp. CC-CFT747]